MRRRRQGRQQWERSVVRAAMLGRFVKVVHRDRWRVKIIDCNCEKDSGLEDGCRRSTRSLSALSAPSRYFQATTLHPSKSSFFRHKEKAWVC